jgi:hypothetical protein
VKPCKDSLRGPAVVQPDALGGWIGGNKRQLESYEQRENALRESEAFKKTPF